MLEKLLELANKEYNGEFMITHTGSLYGVCLGMPKVKPETCTNYFATDEDLDRAIDIAISERIDAEFIENAVKTFDLIAQNREYYSTI